MTPGREYGHVTLPKMPSLNIIAAFMGPLIWISRDSVLKCILSLASRMKIDRSKDRISKYKAASACC